MNLWYMKELFSGNRRRQPFQTQTLLSLGSSRTQNPNIPIQNVIGFAVRSWTCPKSVSIYFYNYFYTFKFIPYSDSNLFDYTFLTVHSILTRFHLIYVLAKNKNSISLSNKWYVKIYFSPKFYFI